MNAPEAARSNTGRTPRHAKNRVPIGLHVVSGINPGNPWGPRVSEPTATFLCRCGHYREARGESQIKALTESVHLHREECPIVSPAACHHCGRDTRALSTGLTGYPAHPECRKTWEDRPVEKRRREQGAKALAAREAARRKTQVLRDQLTRAGIAPDVIRAIVSGGMPVTPEMENSE